MLKSFATHRLLRSCKNQTRSAARSFALRDRGLRSISSSSAVTGFLVSTLYVPSCAPSRNASFTMRSSSEWKLMITNLPPFFRTLRRRVFTQQRLQVVKFTVHQNSESLKGLGRRMNAPLSLVHWPGRSRYDLRKVCGGANRPRPNNGSGDSPRPPFLTEFVNRVGKLALVEAVYHLFGGLPGLRIHPHIQGALPPEN